VSNSIFLGRRFSKHKMTRYAKHFGAHGPLPPLATPMNLTYRFWKKW